MSVPRRIENRNIYYFYPQIIVIINFKAKQGQYLNFLWSVSRQAHVYIIAGACLSLGFRFAGSENLSAFNCLVRNIFIYSVLFYFLQSLSMLLLTLNFFLLFFQHKFAKDFMTYLSAPNASVVSLFMMILLGNKIKLEENSLIIQSLLCCLTPFSVLNAGNCFLKRLVLSQNAIAFEDYCSDDSKTADLFPGHKKKKPNPTQI